MIDFVTALKAKLPFIAIRTDDPVNVQRVLKELSGKPITELPTSRAGQNIFSPNVVYITETVSVVQTELYRKLDEAGASVVVINPDKTSVLMMETGTLPTPVKFLKHHLQSIAQEDLLPALIQSLQGLSLRTAQEVTMLTMARAQALTPSEVRRTRQILEGDKPGLTLLDTDYDFYDWPEELWEWQKDNADYFMSPTTPQPLMPRGIILNGPPGVGKTMGAMAVANEWKLPLFRLDVALTLDRYLSVSENRFATNLRTIEQNAPCVWLLDEAEKLFGGTQDEGTPQRMLGQLLWWLQYHKSRVITVLTTNDINALPKELYRPGRLDRVITVPKLNHEQSVKLAAKTYKSLMGKNISTARLKAALEKLNPALQYSHSEIRVMVYDAVKRHKWLKEPESENILLTN